MAPLPQPFRKMPPYDRTERRSVKNVAITFPVASLAVPICASLRIRRAEAFACAKLSLRQMAWLYCLGGVILLNPALVSTKIDFNSVYNFNSAFDFCFSRTRLHFEFCLTRSCVGFLSFLHRRCCFAARAVQVHW
jgi:hypothetical protein